MAPCKGRDLHGRYIDKGGGHHNSDVGSTVWLLLADKMKHDGAPMWRTAMLEQVDALPGAKCQATFDHGDRQLRLRQRGADVRRHVVGPFRAVDVASILRRDPLEKFLEVGLHVGIGVLLDHQRCRRVPTEDREKAGLDAGGRRRSLPPRA